MTIHRSSEDYLEMILMIREQKGYVRSIDVAQALNVTKPSVSVAMKKLRENGYITFDKDNFILLSVPGEKVARHMYERHKVLSALLIRLGVSEDVAREDACKIEHDISDETFDAICRYVQGK
ncbi:MAG: metal-dependent transcriptional regulator [Clostridia bacterium]|nr:metal-dependent transcriptional regulator [Clostridia bacterium]